MKILKFGGSSVSNAENINKTIEIIKKQSHEISIRHINKNNWNSING